MFTVLPAARLVALIAPVNETVAAVPLPMFWNVSAFTPLMVVPVASAPATAPVCSVRLKPPPVTAPSVMSATLVVAAVLIVVSAASVIAVFPSPSTSASLLVRIVPPSVRAVGVVTVAPPLKVRLSPELSPSCTVPVLAKLTALVMVPPPLSARL